MKIFWNGGHNVKKRIIPLLLLNEDRLIKTVNFDKYKDVGDPISTVKIFSDSDADEIIFLNIDKKIGRKFN